MSRLHFTFAGCAAMTGGWPDDGYKNGKLEFVDAGYTIPNRAVRQTDGGFSGFVTAASYTGDDVEVVNRWVPYRRQEKRRTVQIPLAVNFWWAEDGTAYTDPTQGLLTSWANLNRVAMLSLLGDGLQTVVWTPWPTAAPITMEAHVYPPTPGEAAQGQGMFAGLVLDVFDLADLNALGAGP